MRVIIAGGGIGGLTAALALHARGYRVSVFEAVKEVRPLGVGINLLPHAVAELAKLDLLEELNRTGVQTKDLSYYNKFGQLIWSEPRGLEAGYPYPQFSIHRGRLQMLLLKTVRARLGTDAVITGRQLLSWRELSDGRVEAVFRDRHTGTDHRETAALLVGADGIHSAIRAALYPDEGMPVWNGAVLWRATSIARPFLSGRSMIMAGHQDQKFVCYPIGSPAEEQGYALINWIAELRTDGRDLAEREDWNRPGRIEDFLPQFRSWRFDWLDVPALIRSAQAIYEYPMVDRDPLPRWTFGPVTLLGDAAHPMYPIGSNGASQAILDAACLARCLAEAGSSLTSALAAYEAERRPKTGQIVETNRRNGPDEVMQIVEDRAPDGFETLDAVISRDELEAIAARYKRIAGFDLASVR